MVTKMNLRIQVGDDVPELRVATTVLVSCDLCFRDTRGSEGFLSRAP